MCIFNIFYFWFKRTQQPGAVTLKLQVSNEVQCVYMCGTEFVLSGSR